MSKAKKNDPNAKSNKKTEKKMSVPHLMQVFETLMRSCGTITRKTTPGPDPTEVVTTRCSVFVEYGFKDKWSVDTLPAQDRMPEPPPPELFDITSREFQGQTKIDIDGYCGGMWDGTSKTKKFTTHTKSAREDLKKLLEILHYLVKWGWWNPENCPGYEEWKDYQDSFGGPGDDEDEDGAGDDSDSDIERGTVSESEEQGEGEEPKDAEKGDKTPTVGVNPVEQKVEGEVYVPLPGERQRNR